MKSIKHILGIVLFCFSATGYSQVGINTLTPLSDLDINGNLSVKVVSLNGGPGGSATPINDGVYISATPTSGNQEFILPNAAAVPGRTYIIRNVSGSVTALIYSFGGNFYAKDSSSLTTAPLNLTSSGTSKTMIIISDGANWTYFF